jgi:hypothetical protein
MPNAVGVLSKCGYGAASGWAADWSAVTALAPFRSESIIAEYLRIQDDNLIGAAGRRQSDQGPLSVRGNLEADLDYYNFGYFMECALGGEDNGLYTITDEPADIMRLEFDKQVSRWRVGSAKVNAIEFSGKPGEAVKIVLELIASGIVQSATAFPSLSLTNYKRVGFGELLGGFMIGDLADALDTPDSQPVEEFKLRMERGLTDPEWDTTSPVTSLEPVINGFRKVTLDLTLSRYAMNTFMTWHDANTSLQAGFSFISPAAKMVQFQIPQMKIISADYGIGGHSIIKPKIKLECYINEDNSQMSVTNEFSITTV